MKRTRIYIILILVLFSGTLYGQENFFVRIWSDVNAYFNTYYNAKVYFKEAQDLYNQEEDKSQLSTRTRSALNKAARQAVVVIDKFPRSSFVDDAMFYYSVCYFQLGNYDNALRQLQDLILRYPDSPYYYEARLWISKSYFQMERKAIAYDLLEQFLENPQNRSYFSDAYSLIGQLALQENDSTKALQAFLQAAENASQKEMRCNMYLEAVEILLARENYEDALRYTDRAARNIKFDEQRARTQLAYIRIHRYQGEYEEASNYIEEGLKDALIAKYWGDILIEQANIFFDTGREKEAVSSLRNIVQDPENVYRNNRDSQAWAQAAYRLGRYYIYERSNIDSSEFYFGRAQTKRRQVKEGEMANQYIFVINQLKSVNGTLDGLANKFPPLADSARAYYELLSDSVRVEKEKRQVMLADTLSLDSARTDSLLNVLETQEYNVHENTLTQYEESANTYTQNLFTIAGLLLFDLHIPDSTLGIYERIGREFTFTPFVPQALYSQAYIWEHELNDKIKADSIKTLITEKYPESEISYHITNRIPQDSLVYLENQKKIHEIETQYIDNNDYKEAVDKLKELLDSEDMDKKNHAHIAYKIAWLYDHELSKSYQTKDSTLTYYHMVRDYHPYSPYASRSIHRIAAIETHIDQIEDGLDTGTLTEGADGILMNGDPEGQTDSDSPEQHPIRRFLPSPARPRPERL